MSAIHPIDPPWYLQPGFDPGELVPKKLMEAEIQKLKDQQGPRLAVDIIILRDNIHSNFVLIRRVYPPLGWALPGGFVEVGESLEAAAVREAKEETCLDVRIEEQLHTYSDPRRDPRRHVVSTVFLATMVGGTLRGADDAKEAVWHSMYARPSDLCFDHGVILEDFQKYKDYGYRRKV